MASTTYHLTETMMPGLLEPSDEKITTADSLASDIIGAQTSVGTGSDKLLSCVNKNGEVLSK